MRSSRVDLVCDDAGCRCGKNFGLNQSNYDAHIEAMKRRRVCLPTPAVTPTIHSNATPPCDAAPVNQGKEGDLLGLAGVLVMHLHTQESMEFAAIKRVMTAAHGYFASLLHEVLEPEAAVAASLRFEALENKCQSLRDVKAVRKLLDLRPLPVESRNLRVCGSEGEVDPPDGEGAPPQTHELDISKDLRGMLDADEAAALQFVSNNARWKEAARAGRGSPAATAVAPTTMSAGNR